MTISSNPAVGTTDSAMKRAHQQAARRAAIRKVQKWKCNRKPWAEVIRRFGASILLPSLLRYWYKLSIVANIGNVHRSGTLTSATCGFPIMRAGKRPQYGHYRHGIFTVNLARLSESIWVVVSTASPKLLQVDSAMVYVWHDLQARVSRFGVSGRQSERCLPHCQ